MSDENNKSVLIIENDQQFEVLVYIRTKSGRVYYDEIENMFGEEKQSVTKLLKSLEDEHYLKKDEVENYVYSVPGKRDELDTELHKYAKNHSKNPYIYNKFLYYENDKINNIKKKLDVFFDQIQTGTGSDNTPNGDLTDIDCISETEIERRLIESIKPRFVDKKYIVSIDFDNSNNEKWLYIKKIDILFDAIEKAIKTKHEPFKKDSYPVFIENINCDRVIFEEVRFDRKCINRHKIIYGGLSLQQCLIFDDLTIDGIQFDLSNIDYKDISFRDSRFISNIRIKNIRIDNSSDNVISFEDSRIDGDISIKHSSLGKTKLFLFQTILGNYVSGGNTDQVRPEKDNKISISEVDLDLDSFINMLDIEMFAGSLELVGLKTIPRTDIMFYPIILQKKDKKNDEENAKCPSTELIISNSTVEEDIIVGNIERFELNNVILSARIIENPKGLMPDIRYRSKTKGLKGTMIKSKLLLASYNSLYKIKKGHSLDTKIVKEKPDIPINKALEFIQLKENFANTGKYDFEDEALLLYMELKPYIDKYNVGKKGKKSWWYQFLYKILYATGKYGVSPRRTFCSIILTWILFAFVYLGVMLFKGGNIVDLGTEINNYNLVFKAFVYSMDQVVPFTSTYNTPYFFVMGLSVLERFIGLFLIGYFSIAVVRKTQR